MLNSWNIQFPWSKPKKDDSLNDTFGTDASRQSLIAVYAQYDNFYTYRGQVMEAFACAPFATGIHKLQTIISELTFTSEHKGTSKLLMKPNSLQSGQKFMRALVATILAWGEGNVRVNKEGTAMSLTVVDPFENAYDSRFYNPVTGRYVFKVARFGRRETGKPPMRKYELVDLKDIINITDFEVGDVRGMSRLVRAWPLIRVLNAANRRMQEVFDEGQDNLTIINSNNDDEDFIKKLTRRFIRARNTKEKIVPVSNVTSIDTQAGITPADSDLRSLRQDLIRELAATIDVPPFVVGATSDTTYNNITARTIAFYSESIVPLVNIIKTEMSHTLQEEVTTDLDALLAGDPSTMVDMLIKKAGGPYMSVDEAREKDGLPKLTPEKLKKSVRNAPGASSPKPPGHDMPPGVDKRDVKPDDDRRGEMPTDDGNMTNVAKLRR